MKARGHLPQASVPPRSDLREMLRRHIVRRSLACMARAAARREGAVGSAAAWSAYREAVRSAVRGFYGRLPAGPGCTAPQARTVSAFEHDGFRVENVLFESFPGWEVNASVFVPTGARPPFPAIVVPVGHSGKQFASYQRPCRFFARCGFLAVTFDPPGQAGEKQPGNDHFHDGVRDYLLGETSSRYFVADALRCIDYLATRDDADLTRGVALTGVSGGGNTTTLAALLDDRIAAIGPSCCVTPLAQLDIAQCYAGCPETHPVGRYAEGVDEVDLLCAGAPRPCLLMAGAQDEVFHVEDTRRLAETVDACYAAAGEADRLAFFVDDGGHDYSPAQAREFARFANRHLRGEPERLVPEGTGDAEELPEHELRCGPRTDVNMRTLAVAGAEALAAARKGDPAAVRRAAAQLAGVRRRSTTPKAVAGEAFQVWVHDWRAVLLRPEPGIELPATWLTSRSGAPTPTLLHFDDAGRNRLLYRHGLLANAMRFLERDQPVLNLLTVDLRGWGDTAPALYPYEMAGWGGVDRYVAYATAALGDPILAMRIRDALAALAWLRAQPEADSGRIVLTGCGLGGVVALHAAAIDGGVRGVVTWETLSSFRSLIGAERYPWPADAFYPRVLRHYDLPELAAAAGCPVCVHGLRDGTGAAAGEAELDAWRRAGGEATSAMEPARVTADIQRLAGKCP